jgi:hypothetical protein
MLEVPRWILATVVIAFATFHAVIGALAWEGYDNHFLLIISIVLYLASIGVSVSMQDGLVVGWPTGLLIAVGAVATSLVANLGITSGQTGTYASWYVGAMGVVLGVLAVRGQAAMAWISAGIVTAIVIQAAGVEGIGTAGVVGMVVLIAAGQATSKSLKRANREVDELQSKELATEAALARVRATNQEREKRLQQVLSQALPALEAVASSKSVLSASEREALLNLEASLRDDIRGRRLNSELVKEASAAARARGVQVILLDEGGLDAITETQLTNVLNKVVHALNSVHAGKIVIRSPKSEKWLVTVMATRPGTQVPDLWLKF